MLYKNMLILKYALKNYWDLNILILNFVLVNLTLKNLWLTVEIFVTTNIRMLINWNEYEVSIVNIYIKLYYIYIYIYMSISLMLNYIPYKVN